MPLFGAHMSIAGGYYKALLAAKELDCQTVQLFTKNNNQWKGKPLSPEDIDLFRSTLRETKLRGLTGHDSYLINLGSPDATLYQRSLDACIDELERAEALGLDYLVMHPGASTDGDEDAGLARIAQALDAAHKACPGYKVQILLETTAGQGRSLGHRFEHIGRILEAVHDPERLGVCLDTCHVFAAGYHLFPAEAYTATFAEFNRIIGIKKLRVFHMNDSLKPHGSRVDRHAHIGKGHIGVEAFRLLVNDKRFAKHPMILETPKEDENDDPMDPTNLATLRGLLAAK